MKTIQKNGAHSGIPSHLDTEARTGVASALRSVLLDAIDLHTQIKVAHWNIQGAQFAALHPLFDTYATALAGYIDAIAERIRVLGHLAVGTARHVANHSRLPEYPQDTTTDMTHVELLLARFDAFLPGAVAARITADEVRDIDTADILTGMISEFDKNAWFLRSALGR